MRRPETTPSFGEGREKLYSSKIELHIARHSIKDSTLGIPDEEIRLTPEGRALAKEKASRDTQLSRSVAFGSPRKRSQETALLMMAGADDAITGDENLQELKEKLDSGLMHGSKLGVDERLNYTDDETTEYGKRLHDAFIGKDYLRFLVEESDQLAQEMGDKSRATYSGKAAAIASIVAKYISIGPRWNQLVTEATDGGVSDTLERYLSTHQGSGESFLAKLIEKTEGLKQRAEFVKVLGNQGFGFVEGFVVSIETTKSNERIIRVSYDKELPDGQRFTFEKEIPNTLIQDIIREGAV
jgi:hypothetical protein